MKIRLVQAYQDLLKYSFDIFVKTFPDFFINKSRNFLSNIAIVTMEPLLFNKK